MDKGTTDEIVRAILGGDIEQYSEIIGLYHLDVWRTVTSMLFDKGRTEELAHNTFVVAYERLDQYRMGADFGVWVKAIARNMVRRELRSRHRAQKRLAAYRESVLSEMEEPDTWSSTTDRRIAALKKCRELLPPQHDRILALRYEGSRSINETAEAVRRTPGAVRKVLTRIRQQLKRCVEKRLETA